MLSNPKNQLSQWDKLMFGPFCLNFGLPRPNQLYWVEKVFFFLIFRSLEAQKSTKSTQKVDFLGPHPKINKINSKSWFFGGPNPKINKINSKSWFFGLDRPNNQQKGPKINKIDSKSWFFGGPNPKINKINSKSWFFGGPQPKNQENQLDFFAFDNPKINHRQLGSPMPLSERIRTYQNIFLFWQTFLEDLGRIAMERHWWCEHGRVLHVSRTSQWSSVSSGPAAGDVQGWPAEVYAVDRTDSRPWSKDYQRWAPLLWILRCEQPSEIQLQACLETSKRISPTSMHIVQWPPCSISLSKSTLQWWMRKAKLGSNRTQACQARISWARPSMGTRASTTSSTSSWRSKSGSPAPASSTSRSAANVCSHNSHDAWYSKWSSQFLAICSLPFHPWASSMGTSRNGSGSYSSKSRLLSSSESLEPWHHGTNSHSRTNGVVLATCLNYAESRESKLPSKRSSASNRHSRSSKGSNTWESCRAPTLPWEAPIRVQHPQDVVQWPPRSDHGWISTGSPLHDANDWWVQSNTSLSRMASTVASKSQSATTTSSPSPRCCSSSGSSSSSKCHLITSNENSSVDKAVDVQQSRHG